MKLIIISIMFSLTFMFSSCEQRKSNNDASIDSSLISNGSINNSGNGGLTGESNIKPLESLPIEISIFAIAATPEELENDYLKNRIFFISARTIMLKSILKKSCSELMVNYLNWWVGKINQYLDSISQDDPLGQKKENKARFMLSLFELKSAICLQNLSNQDLLDLLDSTKLIIEQKIAVIQNEISQPNVSNENLGQLIQIKVFLEDLLGIVVFEKQKI